MYFYLRFGTDATDERIDDAPIIILFKTKKFKKDAYQIGFTYGANKEVQIGCCGDDLIQSVLQKNVKIRFVK